jgi:RNA polymerase sigma-70 factor (ECF subfamily)
MPGQPLDIRALYDAHAHQVWRMVARLGVPEGAVEDVVQDVFLTAHRRLPEFAGRSSPLTWLFGIAMKLAANGRRRRTADAPVPPSLIDTTRAPDEQLDRRRAMKSLDRALAHLPDEQRDAVVLMDLEQLTAAQVAEALEVNVNTVYSRLRLGRLALARALNPEVNS